MATFGKGRNRSKVWDVQCCGSGTVYSGSVRSDSDVRDVDDGLQNYHDRDGLVRYAGIFVHDINVSDVRVLHDIFYFDYITILSLMLLIST
jgi:hypothetical protein